MRCVLAALAGMLLAGAACAEPAFIRLAAGEDELVLAADDIATTKTILDQAGQPALLIALSDDAAHAVADFTGRHVGMVLDIFVCEALIVSPMISSEISGGQMMLTGDTVTLGNRLRAKSCK